MPHLVHRPTGRRARRPAASPSPSRPSRRRPRWAGIALAVAVLAALVAPGLPAPGTAGAEPPPPPAPPGHHVVPVDAPVAEAFRPPEHPFGPGNRGLKYATEVGTPVRATADGEVVFAGPVAGALHVTVLHPDGLRTSYSFLAQVGVRVGQPVEQGQVVGLAGELFHLGARRGDAYLDPASLFAPGPVHVRLVPFDDPIPLGRSGERSALRQLVGGVTALAGEVVSSTTQGLRLAGHLLSQSPYHNPAGFTMEVLRVVSEAQRDADRPCTEPGVSPPPPAGRRVAVLVGGLGSSSDAAAIDDLDVAALGYAPGDVTRFSYTGGQVPGGPTTIDAPQRAYGGGDTHRDPVRAAADLADLLEAAVRAAGGAPVDVVAHSLGGVVARLALEVLAERHGEAWLASIGLLATLGTPHQGADLATMAESVGRSTSGTVLLGAIDHVTGLGARSPAVGQLSEVSDQSRRLARTAVPGPVPAVSIAASGDLVVAVPRTRLPGATSVVVRSGGLRAHDGLPGSRAAHRELALALAAEPPTCRSFGDALRDRASGGLVGLVTDGTTGAITYGTVLADGPLGLAGPSVGDAGRVAPLVDAVLDDPAGAG